MRARWLDQLPVGGECLIAFARSEHDPTDSGVSNIVNINTIIVLARNAKQADPIALTTQHCFQLVGAARHYLNHDRTGVYLVGAGVWLGPDSSNCVRCPPVFRAIPRRQTVRDVSVAAPRQVVAPPPRSAMFSLAEKHFKTLSRMDGVA